MFATGGAILIAALIGAFLVYQFIQAERAREMQRWQVRLGIVADSRFAEIDAWMDRQTAGMRSLAQNESLQLYMTLLYDAESDGGSDVQAELEYLGNLLTVVASRSGYSSEMGGGEVSANVSRVGAAGISLVDENGALVVGSPGAPPIQGQLRAFVEGTPRGESAVSDLFIGANGKPSMAFLAPVFALQADESASAHIATIIGVREVDTALYPLLEQPGNVDQTTEAVIVRAEGSVIEYLTPLADGTEPLKLRLAVDTPDLIDAWATRSPGGFSIGTDYTGNEVLAVSRAFSQTPWTLVYKINTSEALADSEARINQLVIAFGLIIVVVVIGGAALWYAGTSKRAQQAADRFERLAERFESQRNFMHVVTDSQPNSIVIFDADGHYRWFNAVAIAQARMERRDLFDKHATAVFGPIEGKRIASWVKECVAKEERLTYTHSMAMDGDEERVYRSELIYLPAKEDLPAGALMVSQDITDSVREKEKREEVMRQLVNTLVSVVDERDPFSANHSVRVGKVARAIAHEMDVSDREMETAGIAGSLMNLGKITVPSEVLTKEGKLTDEEFALIRDSVQVSAHLVRNVDFEGPVADTLAQMQENFDGSGSPQGLEGESILTTSRIVAVANAFVGMVSARAWRDGMPFEAAIDQLLADSNKKFDRRVVIGLANHVDNHGGREAWSDFGKRPVDGE